jgi:hypothetical protein
MKSIKLFACVSIVVVSLQACSKADVSDVVAAEVTTSTQTIDAVVDQNGKYSVTLPATVSGYTISTDALHSSTSKIVVNNTNNTEVYEYEPVAGFTGTDVLVLTGVDTLAGGHEGGGCGKGKRPGGKDSSSAKMQIREQKVNVNITVTPTTIPS